MGYCVTTAKGAAETLKFNMALVLFPVCRNTITWIRSKTKIGAVVPFNDNINFHKVKQYIDRTSFELYIPFEHSSFFVLDDQQK